MSGRHDENSLGGLTRTRRVVSMRLIVSAAAATLVAVCVVGVGAVSEKNTRELLVSEVETRLLLEASNLANLSADALLDHFPELTLNPVVSEIQAKRPNLAVVAVLDHKGSIKGHADVRMYGMRLAVLDSVAPVSVSLDLADGESFLGNDNLLVVTVDAMRADGQRLGQAVVGLRRDAIDSVVAQARRQVIVISAALLLVSLSISILLMSRLLRPVSVLRKGLERIGRGELQRPMILNDRTELGLLADTVNEMAASIYASQRDLVDKERLAHEMDLAKDIQLSLLPDTFTIAHDFIIEGSYKAAAEVGGDFFDVFSLPDGRVGCIIADVAGKGLGGCLVTSMLAVLIRSQRNRFESPRDLLIALEEGLVDQLAPGVFVTAFYGILDAEQGVLTYASAAHSPLLVYRAGSGEVERYETRGIPIGAVRGGVLATTLDDEQIDLALGDLALQYTDGLNEAPHAHTEEEFGFPRIVEVIEQAAGSGRRVLLNSLEERTRRWSGQLPQSDDLTLLAISREGAVHQRVADRVTGFSSDEELLDNLMHALHLKLSADLDHMDEIGRWIELTPGLDGIPEEQRGLLETGLFEICANIAEHGYGGDTERTLDIWWQPDAGFDADVAPTLLQGHFLIRDRGQSFDPKDWTPPDLNDEAARLKGRGLGMLMVDKLARDKTYLPNTAVGNLYLVRFKSLEDSEEKETVNA